MSMTRHLLALMSSNRSLLALSAFSMALTCWSTAAPQHKPNVLFIIADDLGRNLGCYGDKLARTPNIDRLAAEGVRFARAYGQGAVCTPSRNSFLTGLSTRTVGIHTKFTEYQKKDPNATSLGRYFRQHGYQTAGFGKIAHTLDHEDPEAWDIREQPKEKALLKSREERKDERTGAQTYRNITQIYADATKTLDVIQADCFEEFLTVKRSLDKPFMAALGFHSPHEPHMVYQRNLDAIPFADIPLLRQPDGASPYNPLGFNFLPWYPDDNTQREVIRSYYAAVNQLDEQVGRVLRLLEQQGIADHTIVVFIGDNGYNHGFRGQWAKHDVYPDVIHLPLLVSAPGGTKAGVTQGLVEYLDIFPTLVDLCGLPAVPGRDGMSFAAQLRNTAASGKEAAYVEWEVPAENVKGIVETLPPDPARPVLPLPEGVSDGHARAVYTKDWCYVEYYGTEIRELYRLDNDPHGYFNIADKHPEVEAKHAELLHKYFPRTQGKKKAEAEKPVPPPTPARSDCVHFLDDIQIVPSACHYFYDIK
jgi:iduronate 2-sulfatase